MIKFFQISIIYFACVFSIQATENIVGKFSIDGDNIQISLDNAGKQDVIISGFIEGLQSSKIRKGLSILPFIKNEELTRFDLTNRNIIWLRLRALDPDRPGLGSSFKLNEVVKNQKLLDHVKAQGGDDLVIEVMCQFAVLDGSRIGAFTNAKVILNYKKLAAK